MKKQSSESKRGSPKEKSLFLKIVKSLLLLPLWCFSPVLACDLWEKIWTEK